MNTDQETMALIGVLTLVMLLDCGMLAILLWFRGRKEAHDAAPAAQADPVRIIRRSTRCFVFGLGGVVPWFGLALAGMAFRLKRQLSRETGESFSLRHIHYLWICGLVLFALFVMGGENLAALATAAIFFGLEARLLAAEYRRNKYTQSNPARHLVYWGIGLAYAGCVVSILIVLLAVIPRPE
jgi:hypothetical protein